MNLYICRSTVSDYTGHLVEAPDAETARARCMDTAAESCYSDDVELTRMLLDPDTWNVWAANTGPCPLYFGPDHDIHEALYGDLLIAAKKGWWD